MIGKENKGGAQLGRKWERKGGWGEENPSKGSKRSRIQMLVQYAD